MEVEECIISVINNPGKESKKRVMWDVGRNISEHVNIRNPIVTEMQMGDCGSNIGK